MWSPFRFNNKTQHEYLHSSHSSNQRNCNKAPPKLLGMESWIIFRIIHIFSLTLLLMNLKLKLLLRRLILNAYYESIVVYLYAEKPTKSMGRNQFAFQNRTCHQNCIKAYLQPENRVFSVYIKFKADFLKSLVHRSSPMSCDDDDYRFRVIPQCLISPCSWLHTLWLGYCLYLMI